MSDELIERPPLIVYRDDIERLRTFGTANGCGDSATALRELLDRARIGRPGEPEVGECPVCGAPGGGLVGYWRATYGARTKQAHTLRGALLAIDAQVFVLDHLSWWQFRERRRRLATIRDTLELVGVEQGMATERKLTP